jgi:hypothetical protein
MLSAYKVLISMLLTVGDSRLKNVLEKLPVFFSTPSLSNREKSAWKRLLTKLYKKS